MEESLASAAVLPGQHVPIEIGAGKVKIGTCWSIVLHPWPPLRARPLRNSDRRPCVVVLVVVAYGSVHTCLYRR